MGEFPVSMALLGSTLEALKATHTRNSGEGFVWLYIDIESLSKPRPLEVVERASGGFTLTLKVTAPNE